MISFIIPIYNAERYLRACVESVLAQTCADLEAVLVDDGSTDGSLVICRELAAADPRVKVVQQANGGPSAARRAGIKASRGEFLAFVDADDMLHPSFAQDMLKPMVDDGVGVATCAFINAKHCRWNIDKYAPIERYDSETAIEMLLYQRKLQPSLCCKVYRRSVLEDFDFKDCRYEDLEAVPRIFERSKFVAYTSNAYYFYRMNEGSFINVMSASRLDVLGVVDGIEARYAGRGRLAPAARDRKFAANCNMMLLTLGSQEFAQQHAQCWRVVKGYRREVLFNRKARLKDRVGAAVSYMGRHAMLLLSKIAVK